eukprot:m.222573 g.222573  ORF g.222573 m.222573 type:complete len:386 (-) comp15936_c0_seq10:176-1333(-)
MSGSLEREEKLETADNVEDGYIDIGQGNEDDEEDKLQPIGSAGATAGDDVDSDKLNSSFNGSMDLNLSATSADFKKESKLSRMWADINAKLQGDPESQLEGARRGYLLGASLLKRQRVKEAKEAFELSLRERKKLLGESHELTADSIVALAGVNEQLGLYAEALANFDLAWSIYNETLGGENKKTQNAALRSATLKSHQDAYFRRALKMYDIALKNKISSLGTRHPSTAVTMINIGSIYKSLGEFEKSLDFFTRALSIRAFYFGDNHGETAAAVSNVAEVYRLEGDHAAALKYYEWAYRIREKAYGSNSKATADTMYNIALVHKRLHNYTKSIECFSSALFQIEQAYGSNHPDALDAKLQVLLLLCRLFRLELNHIVAIQGSAIN